MPKLAIAEITAIADRVLANAGVPPKNAVLQGEANLLVFPNLESANLSMTLLKELNNGLHIGPILMGTKQPAHIVSPTVTSRGLVNMAAIAATEAAG